ncbi:MAG: hypothetical protein K2M95_02405 [Clostridiales bacterium]|nr:hypothetical protein [Clostridiales bacterium]
MQKSKRITLIVTLLMLVLSVSMFAVACKDPEDSTPANSKATLTFTYTLPDGRTESDVSGKLPNAITVDVGADVTVPDTTFSVRGCKLIGWTDGETTYVVDDTFALTTSRTLTAVFNVGYVGADGYAYLEDGSINFTFGDYEVTVPYVQGTAEYDFTVTDAATRGHLWWNETNKTFKVKEWATAVNEYVLYLPSDGSINVSLVLTLKDQTTATVSLEIGGAAWATGTYAPVEGTADEFEFTVSGSTYLPIGNEFRFKTGYMVERDDAVYGAYMLYDDTFAGTYTSGNDKLVLDAYGFATYKGQSGTYTERTDLKDVEEFEDVLLLIFTNEDRTDSVTMKIDGTAFTAVGNEIGAYNVWDPVSADKGWQKFVLDGKGGLIIQSKASRFGRFSTVATGSYNALGNNEFSLGDYTLEDGEELPEEYVKGMRFKLTVYNYGGYDEAGYIIYNAALYGSYVTADGSATLVLDGYGNAEYTVSGQSVISGTCSIVNDLVLVLGADDDMAVFQIDGTAFQKVGIEIGRYFLYNALDGLDEDTALYFNGRGEAILMRYNEATEQYDQVKTGQYVALANGTDEWTVTFADQTMRVKMLEVYMGYDQSGNDIYIPVYLVYNAAWDGTYTNGSSTLVLDGYGFKATYTGTESITGPFTVTDSIVTIIDSDNNRAVFRLANNNTFAVADASAGLHYTYDLETQTVSDAAQLYLDGLTTAKFMQNGTVTEGTYALLPDSEDEYEFTAQGVTFRFKLGYLQSYGITVYIRYNENWSGEYTFDDDEDQKIVLDGYGNVTYTDRYGETDTYTCTVAGSQGTVVTFKYDSYTTFTFLLDKSNHTYERAYDPAGYYYFYDGETVSGYKRVFLDGKGNAEISEYNNETKVYEVTASGTYAAEGSSDSVFTFTPSSGSVQAFTFKADEKEGYNVYRLADGIAGEYTCVVGENTYTFTADGFGSATYRFYDDDYGYMRTLDGEYTVEGNTVTFTMTSYGYVVFEAVLTIDTTTHTFTVVSQG